MFESFTNCNSAAIQVSIADLKEIEISLQKMGSASKYFL